MKEKKMKCYRIVTVGAEGCIRSYTRDYKSLVIDGQWIRSIRQTSTRCTLMGAQHPVSSIEMWGGEIYDVVGSVAELEERFKPTQKEMEEAR